MSDCKTEELEALGERAMRIVEALMNGANKVRAINEDSFAVVLFPLIVEKLEEAQNEVLFQ